MTAIAVAAFVIACGGRDGPAAFRARDAPASCMEMLEAPRRDRCLAGEGDACVDAVLHMTSGIVSFGSSVRIAFPEIENERERCAIAFLHHGCTLESGQSCLFLGGVLSSLGRYAESVDASSKACVLGKPDGCWYAADIDRGGGNWPVPDARQRALMEKACDLGSAVGCNGLASLILVGGRFLPSSSTANAVHQHRADVRTGLAYWERACVNSAIRRECWRLHEYLKDPSAPRTRDDQWLLLASTRAPEGSTPRDVATREALHARGAELLANLDRACSAQRDVAACWKLVELESLDYGSPASFDPPDAPRRALPTW